MTQPRREATGGEPTPIRRRAPWTRLSVGHLLMLVAGILAALANLAILRANDDSTQVVAASRDVAAGSILTNPDLKLVSIVSQPDVLRGLHANPVDLVGMVATHAISAGDLLTSNSVAATRPSGKRTMSLPIEKSHAVGGSLQPGDVVDVIAVSGETVEYVAVGVPVVAVATASTGGLNVSDDYHVIVEVDATTALRLTGALAGDGMEVIRATGAPAPTLLSQSR